MAAEKPIKLRCPRVKGKNQDRRRQSFCRRNLVTGPKGDSQQQVLAVFITFNKFAVRDGIDW
jgi:hypothetical protein